MDPRYAALDDAARLDAAPGVEVLNDVVLNRVLVRFGDDDELTNAVIDRSVAAILAASSAE
jgi:hypothetical protein